MTIEKCLGFSLILALVLSLSFAARLEACSVLRVTAQDGTIISARTMEFGSDLKPDIVVIPRGREFISPDPAGQPGLKWKNKYGYVAVDAFGDTTAAVEGLNETGLAFSALWYEEDTQYQKILAGESGRALAHALVGSWVLGNFSTVDQVKEGIKKVKVFGLVIPEMGGTPPFHFAVKDAAAGSIVIEYDQGQLNIHDNPLGIMTNAPNFTWQMTNLRNYVGLSIEMPKPQDFAGVTLRPTGHGMFGLPGDSTPPSRFVRMAVMAHFADRVPDVKEALNMAQHLIYALEIIKGTLVDRDAQGKIISSGSTQWASFRDLTNRVFYYRTYDNFTLRQVDLKQLDFKTAKSIPLYGDPEAVIDLTGRFK